MKTELIILGLIITFTGFSQSIDSVLVKGQVISLNKNPLPGVYITVVNTKKDAISDVCGQF